MDLLSMSARAGPTRKRSGASRWPTDGRESTPRRRQPQISCEFCRRKKLKCDRLQPCSSCASRGIECHGQPDPAPPPGRPDTPSASCTASPDLLRRIHNLERAVFGTNAGNVVAGTPTGRFLPSPPSQALSCHSASFQASSGAVPSCKEASTVESMGATADSPRCPPYSAVAQTGTTLWRASSLRGKQMEKPLDYPTRFVFHISGEDDISNSTVRSATLIEHAESPYAVWLPARQDALDLLQDYVDNCLHLTRIIYEVAARSLFVDVYELLVQGRTVPNNTMALLLCICATSAFHWSPNASQRSIKFASGDEAAQCSFVWRKVVWDLLLDSRKDGALSLEGVQATMLLEAMVYNVEGVTSRYRLLLSASLAGCRDLSLHLTDSPSCNAKDDAATKEIKRRVWWYNASSDWLLSCICGPCDRTYTVQPKHACVRLPKNINDKSLQVCDSIAEAPREAITDMSYFLARIRLAEACRQIAGILTLDVRDVTDLEYDKVLCIDGIFENLCNEMPPAFALDVPLPPEAPPSFWAHRQIMNLAIAARRARVFRPFIQSPIVALDRRFQRFRCACLCSAQSVVQIAAHFLTDSFDIRNLAVDGRAHKAPQQSRPSQNELVIYHLFQACVALAADPSLTSDSPGRAPDAEQRRRALIDASRLMEEVGKKSLLASGLVKRLFTILRSHRIDSSTASCGDQAATAAVTAQNPSLYRNKADQPQHMPDSATCSPRSSMATVNCNQFHDDPLTFETMWDGLTGVVHNDDSWEQLFVDLDNMGGLF